MQRIEGRLGKPIDQILREYYVEQGLTVEQVGQKLGQTKGTVSRWLARFGIEARRPGTASTAEAVA